MRKSALLEKTILLVEDEKEVREIIQLILRSRGVEVISASSPDEALQIVSSRLEPIDLVISDIVMPGMSGPELMRQLGRTRSETPVLYMSGYSERDFEPLGGGGRIAFLGKPFLPDELVERAESLIGGENAAGGMQDVQDVI
ncbi:response regulator [Salinispira pacifica]